jgi:hypothetical protein
MKPILKDASMEAALSDQGYVVVPFLTAGEVQSLKDFYYQHLPAKLDGMYATAHAPDISFRLKMNDFIKETFARAIDQLFIHHQALGGSYIAKGKGQAGTLNPHQDWNIVDEGRFRSFNIWVPLVDLNDTNGVICVMPGSHQWLTTYRSANIDSAYHGVEKELWERMVRLPMEAGSALIYDHRLIHASGENKTDEIRLATVYGIISDDAPMYYYHKKDGNTIEVYESNKEFFLYENIFEGPKKLKKISEVSYRYPVVTAAQLDQFTQKQQHG